MTAEELCDRNALPPAQRWMRDQYGPCDECKKKATE